MALCESQLDVIPLKRESSPGSEGSKESPEKKPKMEPNGDIFAPGAMPLAVDYRSPVSHFVPPELFAAKPKPEPPIATPTVSQTTPVKRKRGRPRVDKTSPEYLANLAARKQAKEMAAVMNNRNESGEKRKRGRPRVDKTSPEYLARKRARELGESRRAAQNEALERKAKREYKRRGTGAKVLKSKVLTTRAKKLPPKKSMRKAPQRVARKIGDKKVVIRRNTKFMRRKESAASSSAGETPRVKRKYTKRAPGVNKDSAPTPERVKGKRGRPRKTDVNHKPQQPTIRVRSNLMPENSEPITLDSDDEPDLGSPSQASDSLSLDENLRALRHIHEKYANIDKDDLYEAHLLAANFKKPDEKRDDDEVLSVWSSEGRGSVKELDRVEKLEDSSGSDSDSSSSGSGSSSSGSSSSSSSSSSSDSDSDSDSESEKKNTTNALQPAEDDRSFGAWSYSGAQSSGSESDPERSALPVPVRNDEISESENESPDKSFQCHICKKWYSTRVTLKIHRRVHQNRGGGGSRQRTRSSDRYECDCCELTFNRREKLWDHKASAHRGAMTVRCDVCRKCFEDEAELSQHVDTHSADERAGRCTDCGASFQRYEQLSRHRLTCARADAGSGAGQYACGQCGKRFTHQHSLTRHAHNHARQLYRCVVCKASFLRADQLAQHLNSHLANYKRLKP